MWGCVCPELKLTISIILLHQMKRYVFIIHIIQSSEYLFILRTPYFVEFLYELLLHPSYSGIRLDP